MKTFFRVHAQHLPAGDVWHVGPPPRRLAGWLQGGGCGGLFDVMLTTYTVWEREGATYSIDRAFLSKWAWSHVVMDEAHALKNSLSTRTRKLCRVAQGAAHRVMLTGGGGGGWCGAAWSVGVGQGGCGMGVHA